MLELLDLVSMVVQILGVVMSLYYALELGCLVVRPALGVMVLMLPLNHMLMRIIASASQAMMVAEDARSSVVNAMMGVLPIQHAHALCEGGPRASWGKSGPSDRGNSRRSGSLSWPTWFVCSPGRS